MVERQLEKKRLDNRIYKNNPYNAYLFKIIFGFDERFISKQRLDRINDNIIFRLINCPRVYVKTDLM